MYFQLILLRLIRTHFDRLLVFVLTRFTVSCHELSVFRTVHINSAVPGKYWNWSGVFNLQVLNSLSIRSSP